MPDAKLEEERGEKNCRENLKVLFAQLETCAAIYTIKHLEK